MREGGGGKSRGGERREERKEEWGERGEGRGERGEGRGGANQNTKVMRNGTSFSANKGSLLLNTMQKMNFSRTTGPVFFDSNGDRLR